jgi:hypothetical protein
MRKLLICSVVVASLAASALSFGAGIDPATATAVQREQAQSRYKRGKERYDAADYPAAYQEFSASLDIVASPNARLYAARSLERMGRLVEAYAEYGRTAVEAKELEHEDGRYGKAGEAASAERALLAPKLGFVEVTVAHPSDATKLVVAGGEIRRAGWTEPVPVMPGTVDLELDSPDRAPVKTQTTVGASAHVRVSLDADAGAGQAVPPRPPPVDTAPQPGAMGWTLPAGIAAGAVGVAGFVTFAVAGAISLSTYGDLQKACPGGPCPPSKQGEVSDGQTQKTVANVGLVIGLVGVAASATLLVLYFTHKHASPKPAAGLYVSPTTAGVTGSF